MTFDMEHKISIKWPLLFSLGVACIFLLVVFVISILQMHADQETHLLNSQITVVRQQIQQHQAKDVMALKSLLLIITKVEKLGQAFIRRDRELLLQESVDINQSLLADNEVTHFYFHDPDGVNFLRVHQPKRYGDEIQRQSLSQSIITGKTAYGVEMGPLGTLTLRVVMPWFASGKLLGYIELGKEISHIFNTIQEQQGIRLLTFIDKKRLHQADWEMGVGQLSYRADWDRFSKLVYMGKSELVFSAELEKIFNKIHWGSKSSDWNQIQAKPFDAHGQFLFHLPIVDMSNTTNGILVGLIDLHAFQEATFNHIKLISLSMVTVAILLLLIFSQLLKQIEQRLQKDSHVVRNSEKLLNQTQAIAQLGSWEWDLKTNQWSWSKEMFRLLGVQNHRIVPDLEVYLACLLPEDRERVRKAIQASPTVSKPDFHVEHSVSTPGENKRILFMLGKTQFGKDGQPIKRIGTLRDVTLFRLKEQQEVRSFQSRLALSALLETELEQISLQHQLEVAIDIILNVPWLGTLYQGSIYLFDEEMNTLVMIAQRNLSAHLLTVCQRVDLGYCMCGRAAQSREIVFSSHIDERHEIAFPDMLDHGHYCVPILLQGRLLGVLNLYVPSGHIQEPDGDAFMSTVGNTLAVLIEHRRTEELLAQQKSDLLETMETNEVFKLLLESAMDPVPIQDQLDQILTMLFYLPMLPIQSKGLIWLPSGHLDELKIKSYTKNFSSSLDLNAPLLLGKCLCGNLVSTEIVIHAVVNKQMEEGGQPDWLDAHCCVPILEQGKMSGLMVIYLDRERELSDKNKKFLRSVASILSVIIIRKRLDTQLVQALEEQTVANQKLDRANLFIRKTFGSYMSDELVKNILDTPEGLRLGGDEKMVTVLMSDLRGFTALSERMPPGDLLTMLNRYLGEMTRIIQDYHGTIIEFLGDGILALFGAPVTREDDADRAVACALSMQTAMIEVNSRNQAAGYPELKMGVGISTGLVIAGNIGSEVRRKYGVVGTTINLTSRIESLTVGGQVLISESTLEACQEALHIVKQWQESFKGVPHPITIAHIIGIGGPDGVHLPLPESVPLRAVTSSLLVRLARVVDKKISQESCSGEIIAMGMPIVEIRTSLQVSQYDNVIISLSDLADVTGEQIYGKVLTGDAQGQSLKIHLTSIPPEARNRLSQVELDL